MFPLYLLILCLLHAHLIGGQQSGAGEECVYKKTNQSGICIELGLCNHAQELLKSKTGIPQHCDEFIGLIPTVCCPERKSVLYCLKHYTPSVFEFIYKGENALAKEFPHMAAIGYGDESDIKWYCGGSLINEQFVLTAAHCINDKTYGPAKWVRLGDLDLHNDTDDAEPQNFTIFQVDRHPDYKPSSHYHDIALIKLDRKADFTDFVKPACLNALHPVNKFNFTITGWGTTNFGGPTSSHLLKAKLHYIDHDSCSRSYASVSERKLKNGIVDDLLICAGRQEGQDTCPGDSGGPLQYKAFNPPHYQIAGVTSFGKACGLDSSVAVYTRVSNYLSWIESIVWPL